MVQNLKDLNSSPVNIISDKMLLIDRRQMRIEYNVSSSLWSSSVIFTDTKRGSKEQAHLPVTHIRAIR